MSSLMNLLEPLPWVDVTVFNGEVKMLQYRVRLHAPLVSTIVIVEANITFAGKPKEVSALKALSIFEKTGLPAKLVVLQVPFSASERSAKDSWVREKAQRVFLNAYIHDNFQRHRVLMSDIDELFDAAALGRDDSLWHHECVAPRMHFYYYSDGCHFKPAWLGPIVFRTDGPFFSKVLREGRELRITGNRQESSVVCPPTTGLVGWHFSYAMPTNQILSKLRSFSHAHDRIVLEAAHANLILKRVKHCKDILGRQGEDPERVLPGGGLWTLPLLPGWPRHQLAPTSVQKWPSNVIDHQLVEEEDSTSRARWIRPPSSRCGAIDIKDVRLAMMGSCLRGTGVAMFNYADFLLRQFGLGTIYFLCLRSNEPSDEDRFMERFGVENVEIIDGWPSTPQATDVLISPMGITHLYMLKSGRPDGVASAQVACNLVHAVFDGQQPHGDRFARISQFVPGAVKVPIVPYMVTPLPQGKTTFRQKLGIPASAIVFGRYGGFYTFNIAYVKQLILELLPQAPNTFFIFANTDRFCGGNSSKFEACPANVHFMRRLRTGIAKAKFIRTCDAMLHASADGEMFGLDIADFALLGKRIIIAQPTKAAVMPVHVQELGDRALYYNDTNSLRAILLRFSKAAQLSDRWGGYKKYMPGAVISQFREIFLPEVRVADTGRKQKRQSSQYSWLPFFKLFG
eukprot:CAMPEP_0119334506 /NCGR_PEP_ID=MMETSP1333-20130426/87464_1 /TAXON_ID=418940 /ORGANISM="Scyphosphaera apsteinii, Strain RCC1455" /LENGTH=682 /DNA_ID=CAMNT_0007344813 /DNA_START=122 /DNA_END=2170 /DNA_ORIENTATION=-